jgi:ABC-type Mn2+/Zn2+ transport system ATPase subunit
MFPETQPQEFNTGPPKDIVPFSQKDQEIFEFLVDKLELGELLDLPLVALSNGQTRRARIIKAIISKPELLLLDEPLSKSLPAKSSDNSS